MARIKDLTSRVFGKVTAIRIVPSISSKRTNWECLCECGTIIITRSDSLLSGHTQSCGCTTKSHYTKEGNLRGIDLTGKTFGRLTVIKLSDKDKKRPYWLCECSCGNTKAILSSSLIHGRTGSCGCIQAEITRCRCKNLKGPLNPAWNPILTDEERSSYNKREGISEWRSSVYRKDGYKCAICGKGGRLNAHHLFSYNAHPDTRLDIENGVTLCEACHKLFHSIYGVKVNYSYQYDEFYNTFNNYELKQAA